MLCTSLSIEIMVLHFGILLMYFSFFVQTNSVFGAKGLRVVDASLFQETDISINHVTIQAIAEVASGIIKDAWRKSQQQSITISTDNDSSNNLFKRHVQPRN